jgi:hypothetical protein
MRDVERIGRFISQLETIWTERVPDWRFFQLMSNAMRWIYSEKKIDPFFIEEDIAMQYIREYLYEYTGE